MTPDLGNTAGLLACTPAALNALLRDLPNFWTSCNEGEGTWSVVDVVGHLVDADRVNWMPRIKHLRTFEDTRAFVPFDRGGHLREGQGKTLNELLDQFTALRAQNLTELRALNLQPHDLERRGLHPSLGSVNLSELLSAWAAHDLTHLHQISRIMADQLREAVGPWKRFLGVLQCTGHSAPA